MIDPRLIVLLNDLIGIANEQSILSTKERWNRERGGWKNRRKRKKGGGNVPVEQGVAAKFIELSSLCTRSRARFPRFYAFHRLFFCVLFLFASSQPPRYRERNVRRRRERPATVEDISRVVYDSLRRKNSTVSTYGFYVSAWGKGTRMAFGNIGIRTGEGEGFFYCALARFISSHYLIVVIVA